MLRKGDLWKARADCTKDITAGALEHFVQLLARKWSYSSFISILHNLPKILEIWFVPAEMIHQDNHSGFVADRARCQFYSTTNFRDIPGNET